MGLYRQKPGLVEAFKFIGREPGYGEESEPE